MKPKVKITGKDANVFNLLGICSKALKEANQEENAKKMANEVWDCASYHEALVVMGKYCELQ